MKQKLFAIVIWAGIFGFLVTFTTGGVAEIRNFRIQKGQKESWYVAFSRGFFRGCINLSPGGAGSASDPKVYAD